MDKQNEEDKKILAKAKSNIDSFEEGYLGGSLNYKFRTRDFLNVVFLYTNSVDVKNPDILGANNKNTFIYEPMAAIEKIKEQIRLDIKDLNFMIQGASSLARFIPKAANRKILEDNNFDEVMDEIPDNAADYGSGFLKVWEDDKGKLKMKSIDPYYIYFNQSNFKDGIKSEKFSKSIQWILDNEKYDEDAKALLRGKTEADKLDDEIPLFQNIETFTDGTQEISVTDHENELVYYKYRTKKGDLPLVSYYKFDYQKRKGFPDALGKGCIEKVFNKIVQSKVNRERMDKVMAVAATLPFQKQIDNEQDAYVGKEVVKLGTSVILGHKGNPISPLDTGGIKQANLIMLQLNGIIATIGSDLNVGEALQGNTMPSGTSGVLGNLLTENSSSVLKEIKKNYAKFLGLVYKERTIPYILQAFDSKDDLRKYLDPNDIRMIEQVVVDYLVVNKQIDAAINNEPFNEYQERQIIIKSLKGKPLISGDLLQKVKDEVQGIKAYISGEDISKAQTVAFLRDIRAQYIASPQLFKDPFFIQLLKKEADYDSGVSGVEIDQLLKELADNPPVEAAAPVQQ
jgi:hypothetical protein